MSTRLTTQIELVDSGAIHYNPDRTFFFIGGGLNDAVLPTATTVSNLTNEIYTIYRAGARFFLLALLPIRITEYTAVGTRLDPAIRKILVDLHRSMLDAHLGLSHWGAYVDNTIENPAHFGISDTTDRCAGNSLFGEYPTSCSDPDAHFFYCDGHPTTAVHCIVAQELKREVAEQFP
jgi:phospholipase/lecithinase/hemolysin